MLKLKSEIVGPWHLELMNLSYLDGGGGIMMAQRQQQDLGFLARCAKLDLAVKEIETLRKLKAIYGLVNKVPPGANAGVHTDTLDCKVERWHLPLITNPGAWFWTEDEDKFRMEAGFWHGPFPYSKNHNVWNEGQSVRVHLVVDLEIV